MEKVADILGSSIPNLKRNTVDSNNKSLPTVNSTNTVNSSSGNSRLNNSNTIDSSEPVKQERTLAERIEELVEEYNTKPEGVAQLLAELLKDLDSIKYYAILVKEYSAGELLAIAHYVKGMDREGKINTNRAIYFQAILRRKGFKTKFKKPA